MLRTKGRGLAAVAVIAAALAAPSVAGAELLQPGDVGTAAYTRMDAETFANAAHLRKSDFERERVDGAASAESSYRWPPPPPTIPSLFTCDADGCAGYDGRAYGRAAVAEGRLQAVATADLHVGNEPQDGYGLAGYIFSDGAAAIADTITLSKAADVVLRGRVQGSLGGFADTDEQPEPRGGLEVSFDFRGDDYVCDIEWCQQERFGGFGEEYEVEVFNCPGADTTCGIAGDVDVGTRSVDEPFEVVVSLPAGTSYFNAEVLAAVHFQVYGDGPGVEASSANVRFGNSVTFEIEVPDDVVVTSGSGSLPIVGGLADLPDTTPPTLVAPADVTVPNAPGRADADVDPGVATAEDDREGVTVAGARSDGLALEAPYPLGVTTITWTATDAAGNTASATQAVTVQDVEDPVLTLPAATTVDAATAAGAVVAYSASATDNSGSATVTCAPASGSTFPVGTTTVSCTAVDAAGNEAAGTFTVTVRGAADQLADLIAFLPEQSLKAKAQAAQASLAKGNTTPACNQLGALLNQVDALEGKKLTAAQAAEIRERVARIRALIGC
jgi:hypothetical protein